MLRCIAATILFAVLALAALPSKVGADDPPTLREVASELMSQCDSAIVLADHDCPKARSMKAEISEQIAMGRTKDEIIDYFVVAYGEKVLAEPPRTGFGLAAWAMPSAALAVGAAGAAVLVLLWVRRRPAATEAQAEAVLADGRAPYETRVDEEIRAWDGEG
jgi:cytochrome c-type biogenesis protein CcmH